jgi:hypothetical protein
VTAMPKKKPATKTSKGSDTPKKPSKGGWKK